MGIFEIIQSRKEEIIEIAHKHGADNVRVFGSVARGEETSDSDIDFLIEIPDFSKISFFFPGGLIVDLEKLLGRKVDIVIYSALKPKIKPEILRDAKALWIEMNKKLTI